MAYSCCFGLGGNPDFPEFLQKMFYDINYWKEKTRMQLSSQLGGGRGEVSEMFLILVIDFGDCF